MLERLLHVRELHDPVSPTVRGESLPEAQQLVDGIVGELKAAGVTGEGAVRPSTGGSPAGPILEYAREVGAGLIVIGSHGRSFPVLTGTPRPTRPEE
jgi:nucleotide-binding universal stress UspA family protein